MIMNNESGSKKIRHIITRQLTVTVTTVFLLVMVIIGSSYALFMDVDTSSNENVYTSGDLVMVFNDETGKNRNTINNTALIPMSNEIALRQTNNIYSFTVTNTGTLPMKYDVLLSDVQEFANSNLLDHKYIKYQLCIKNMDNCTIIRDLSSVEEGVIYQSNLTAGEQIIYYLRVWITNENIPNDAQEKEVHLEVNINGISANESYLAYYLTDNAKVKQVDVNNWYASENNYIKYNNETWRIIGVFSKLDNGQSLGSRVKIIKETPIHYEHVFDQESNVYMDSDLRIFLNETYLNTINEKYRELAEPVKINDIETNDLKLLASKGNILSFTKYPDVLNKHTLTITFTDVNGNSISCSFVYDFAKYKFVDYSELEEYYKID